MLPRVPAGDGKKREKSPGPLFAEKGVTRQRPHTRHAPEKQLSLFHQIEKGAGKRQIQRQNEREPNEIRVKTERRATHRTPRLLCEVDVQVILSHRDFWQHRKEEL